MKVFVVFLFVVLVLVWGLAYLGSVKQETIIVKNKERAVFGSGEQAHGKYMVYTTNEVFENTDSGWFMKFNSADIQNQLEPGKTYKVKVAGWRVPFFSWFRNIIAIK